MPKKGYNLSKLDSVSKRFVSSTNHPTVSILNDLKKELNNLLLRLSVKRLYILKIQINYFSVLV